MMKIYWLKRKLIYLPILIVATSLLLLISPTISVALSQTEEGYFYQARSIETDDLGISSPAGLGFSAANNALLVLDESSEGAKVIKMISYMVGENAGSFELPIAIPDPINSTFDEKTNSLYFFDQVTQELVQIKFKGIGLTDFSIREITRNDAQTLGIQQPLGLAIDPVSGDLFYLDGARQSIKRLRKDQPQPFLEKFAGDGDEKSEINLGATLDSQLQGLAIDPNSGHLFVFGSSEQALYEYSPSGQLISTRDLSQQGLTNPQGMVFAPSGDSTDDADNLNLYIADSGSSSEQDLASSQIVELSLQAPELMALPAVNTSASMVQTIDTSAFSPSSPDPAGVSYRPDVGRVIISDSEVEEMGIYAGVNIFETTTGGTLETTCDTTYFSNEPTGAAVNPQNGHIFFPMTMPMRFSRSIQGRMGNIARQMIALPHSIPGLSVAMIRKALPLGKEKFSFPMDWIRKFM